MLQYEYSHGAKYNQGLISLVFSEVAEIARVAQRQGQFLQLLKIQVILIL